MGPMGYFHGSFHGCFPERLRSRALLFMTDSANFHLANATEFSKTKNPPFFFHGFSFLVGPEPWLTQVMKTASFAELDKASYPAKLSGWDANAFRSGQVLILQILHSHKTAPALGNLSSLRHPTNKKNHQIRLTIPKKIPKKSCNISPKKRGNILQQQRSLRNLRWSAFSEACTVAFGTPSRQLGHALEGRMFTKRKVKGRNMFILPSLDISPKKTCFNVYIQHIWVILFKSICFFVYVFVETGLYI